jgi:predicted XRE-type DNA-binding protein
VSIGGGKYLRTHKAAFVVFVGDVGEYDVLHRCDVRACCNPEHLYLGSHSDNMIDRVRRGRQTNTRMSKELVREILSWYIIGGWTQRDLAEAFGVTKQTLNDVVLGRTYSWLTGIQKKAG